MKKTRIDEALESNSKNCYENGVLINKLGITNQEELDKVEASLTYLRLNMLSGKDNGFKFDYMYYLNLHGFIFQDIYPFAGEIRDENISKPVTFNFKGEIKSETIPFCRPEFIVQYLKYLLDEMAKKVRNIKTKDDYIEYLSYYYSELNIVHPFREGNGRTQREYFRQLVEFLNNYLPLLDMKLDYSSIDETAKNNLMNGSIISAVNGDVTCLKEFFKIVLKEKNIETNLKDNQR